MIHEMNLRPQPFSMIARDEKTIELRLDDEKRRKIRVGDTILFTNTETPEKTMAVKVLALHRFSSFSELYAALPLDKCGYTHKELKQASSKDMEDYYSPVQQAKYGVLGIEIRRVELETTR